MLKQTSKLSHAGYALLLSLALTACTATPEQIASRQEFETKMADISLSVAREDVAVAVPQCLRDLAGKPVDEAALAVAKYIKTQALLGGFSYKKSISPAGFAKYENSRRVVAGSAGGDCRFEATSGPNASAYKAALESYLAQNGYIKGAADGGTFKNKQIYSGKGLKFTATVHSSRTDPVVNIGFSNL